MTTKPLAALIALAALTFTPAVASADHHGGGHGGSHGAFGFSIGFSSGPSYASFGYGGYSSIGFGYVNRSWNGCYNYAPAYCPPVYYRPPVVYSSPPVIYAPAPAIYSAPPAVYYPSPVYYSAPSTSPYYYGGAVYYGR